MNLLLELREKHGLNKVQMAKRLRIAKSYYSMLENGERPISKNIAIKLHEEFNVPFESSFSGLEVHIMQTNNQKNHEATGT